MKEASDGGASLLALPSAAQALADLKANNRREPPLTPPARDRSIAEIAWAGRGFLAVGLIMGLLGGFAFYKLTPKSYESRAEVYIERPKNNGESQRLNSGGVASASPTTQASVLKSTGVLRAVLSRPEVQQSLTLSTVSDHLLYLRKKLKIQGTEDKEVVTVSFRSAYAEESAMIVNAVLDAYFQRQHEHTRVGIPRSDPDTAQANARMAPLTSWLGASGSYALTDDLVQQRLKQLTESYSAAELAVAQTKTHLESALAADNDDVDQLIQIAVDAGAGADIQETVVESLKADRLALTLAQRRLAGVPEHWGDKHRIKRTYIADVMSAHRALALSEAEASDLVRKTIRDRHRVALAQRDVLAQQLKSEQRHAEQLTRLPLVLLEEAHVPTKPASPTRAKSLGGGGVLGLMLAMGFLVIRDLRQTAGGAGDDPSPERVTTPPQSGQDVVAPLRPHDLETGFETAPLMLGSVPRIAATHRLMAPNYDMAGTSVHHVRAILQILARKQNIRSLGFVSPVRGSGKTSLSVGVASSLAMSGTRTLVADCDLAGRLARGHARAGRGADGYGQLVEAGDMHRTIDGIACASGHLDVDRLAAPHHDDSVPDDDRHANGNGHGQDSSGTGVAGMIEGLPLSQCVVPSPTPGLAFLPAHMVTPSHIGQMSDGFVGRMVEQANEQFDMLLVDTGPVPGSVEALLVASRVDAVVIVLDETVGMQDYQRMLSYLKIAGATIAGTVFNKVTDEAETAAATSDPDAVGLSTAEAKLYGSGILAASVLTDPESGFTEMDWERVDVEDVVGGLRPEK